MGTPGMNESLKEYVEAARQGDMEAFEYLYYASLSTVQAVARKELKNSYDVDDAIQETYLKIYQKLDRLSDPEKFVSWSGMVARNTSRDLLRKKQSRTRLDDYRPARSDDEYEGLDTLSTEDYMPLQSPEAQVEDADIAELLNEILADLPEKQRKSYLLWSDGYGYKEIGEAVGTPEGTAKSNVRYARQKIEKAIRQIEEERGIKLFSVTFLPVASGFTVEYEIRAAKDAPGLPATGSAASSATEPTTPAPDTALSSATGLSDAANWNQIKTSIAKGAADSAPSATVKGSVAWKKVAATILAILVAGGIAYSVAVSVDRNEDGEPELTYSTSFSTQLQDEDEEDDSSTTNTTRQSTTSRTTARSTTRTTTSRTTTTTTRTTTASDDDTIVESYSNQN